MATGGKSIPCSQPGIHFLLDASCRHSSTVQSIQTLTHKLFSFSVCSHPTTFWLYFIKSKDFLSLSRPPDRRRREVFGFPNSTFLEGSGGGNSSLGTWDNSTDGIPPIREYPFSEDKVTAESIEIPLLRPFTVYRIDLHACNEVVGRCSAGAFIFARTKPAGWRVTQALCSRLHSDAVLSLSGLRPFCHFFSLQWAQMTSQGRWCTRRSTRWSVAWCCTGLSQPRPTDSSSCMRSSSASALR